MAGKYKEDEYAMCPFYFKENGIEIKCTGLCGHHTINEFRNGKDKKLWKYDFCNGYYWNCPLYRALEEEQEF